MDQITPNIELHAGEHLSADQQLEIRKFFWCSRDESLNEEEALFSSDIERIIYLTDVKFDHQSRIKLLEAEVR